MGIREYGLTEDGTGDYALGIGVGLGRLLMLKIVWQDNVVEMEEDDTEWERMQWRQEGAEKAGVKAAMTLCSSGWAESGECESGRVG